MLVLLDTLVPCLDGMCALVLLVMVLCQARLNCTRQLLARVASLTAAAVASAATAHRSRSLLVRFSFASRSLLASVASLPTERHVKVSTPLR